MLNLETLKSEYKALLEKSKTENRSLTADETTRLDTIKGEITKLENEAAAKTEADRRDEQHRSIAAAQQTIKDNLNTADKNVYLRSIAKGSADVGNKEVIADVVRVFETTSPIYAAHRNVQTRSTGNTFSFTKVNKGSSNGGKKAENAASDTDTTSSITMGEVKFATYRSEKIPVSQEMIDDAFADISQEITTLGMSKSVLAFGSDAVKELRKAFGAVYSDVGAQTTAPTFTETAATTWSQEDLINAFFELPPRHRIVGNVKFTCNSATAAVLVNMFTITVAPALAAIGLSLDNMVVDDNVDDDTVILGDITKALAIGRKDPIRIWVQEIETGRVYEVQPRFAVALRDATATSARKLKAA